METRSRSAPSVDWHEVIAPDEGARHAAQAQLLRDIQARKSARWGPGRALHRKQLAVAQGTLEVLDGLPAFARHGLFAEPHDYEVTLRLSNGGMDRASDSMPDIRGLALRVRGVQGASALDAAEPAATQDFTFINQEAFAFAGSEEFVAFVAAASEGRGALLRHLVGRHGVLGAPRQLLRMLRVAGRPFSGFATEPLFSALPMANGPYAVRLCLRPDPSNGRATLDAQEGWGAEFAARLRHHPLHWDLQMQYFSSEAITPIEDASVVWPTPYATVARLMLPEQDLDSPEGRALAESVERSVFDPWHALAEHRPLGEVQRARKVVYFASQQGRGAA